MRNEWAYENEKTRTLLLLLCWIWKVNPPIPRDLYRTLSSYLYIPVPKDHPRREYELPLHAFERLQANGQIPMNAFYAPPYLDMIGDEYHRDTIYTNLALCFWQQTHPDEYEIELQKDNPPEFWRKGDTSRMRRWKNKRLLG
jgi:hypothetical protein